MAYLGTRHKKKYNLKCLMMKFYHNIDCAASCNGLAANL